MKNDICELLLKIKDNIKYVENGATAQSVLDEVRVDFLELIELLKLFLISERDSYYGYFLMNMQFRTNFRSNSIAGIKLNEFPPVFESNPLLLCKFSLKEIIFVVCHEIDHVVLNHPTEMAKANPTGDSETYYRFNLAADAAVNDRINHEIVAEKHNFLSAPDGIITSPVLAQMFGLKNVRPMENYAYYFNLIGKASPGQDNTPQNGQQSMLKKLGENAENSSQEENLTENEGETPLDDNENPCDKIVNATNCGAISDHNWEVGDDVEDATATVKEFVNAAFGMMNNESRGMMPGYFLSQVKELNKPAVLSWQAILKKYVGTITANKRKTKMRLNRRQPERFDLSGTVDDKLLKIVVAIDTSGSVNDKMIENIFSEIFAILAKRKHDITVIECDVDVRRVYKAKTPGDIKTNVCGRGGTYFSPAINFVNNDKYFRDALMIYFTDGYGEREIPKPKTYRNIWVVVGDARHLSLKEPYGAVLTL